MDAWERYKRYRSGYGVQSGEDDAVSLQNSLTARTLRSALGQSGYGRLYGGSYGQGNGQGNENTRVATASLASSAREQEKKSSTSVFGRVVETGGDVIGNILAGAAKTLEGIWDLGLGVVGGIGGALDADEFQDTMRSWVENDFTGDAMAATFEKWTDDSYLNNSRVGGVVESVAQGVGQLLPAVAISIATGGAGAATLGMVGASAAGNATESAFADGADYGRGLLYGAASGVVEMGTEAIMGGLGGLFGQGLLPPVTRSIATRGGSMLGRVAVKAGKEALGEAAEEALAEVAQPALKSIYKGREAYSEYGERDYWRGVGESALVGGLTSVAYGGTLGRITKTTGRDGLINDALSELDAAERKRNRLDADDALDRVIDKRGMTQRRALGDTIRGQIDTIEQVLTSVKDTDARQRMIERHGLGDKFEADGHVKAAWAASMGVERGTSGLSGTPAPTEETDTDGLNTAPAGMRSAALTKETAREALRKTGARAFTGEMSTQAQAELKVFKKAFGALRQAAGGKYNFIIAEPMEGRNAALVDGNTVVIGADQFESGANATEGAVRAWVGAMIHEVEHGTEGTAAGERLSSHLKGNAALFDATVADFAERGYFDTETREDVQDSLVVLDNGNTYVKADRNVITEDTIAGQRRQITDFFTELLNNKKSLDIQTVEGDVLTITKDETAVKARDNYKTEQGRSVQMTSDEFLVKLRAETHIDELAESSSANKGGSVDTKNHGFAKDGFTYRTAFFEDLDGQYYKLTLSIGHNGETATVYNVGKIKKDNLPSAARIVAGVGSKPIGKSSTVSITENSDLSTPDAKNSQKADAENGVNASAVVARMQELVEKAKSGATLTEAEQSDLTLMNSELNAILSERALSNEHFIRRLVREDTSVAQRILNGISDMVERLSVRKDKELAKSYQFLKTAEDLYLSAVAESGWRYEKGRIVRDEEEKENTDTTSAGEVKWSLRAGAEQEIENALNGTVPKGEDVYLADSSPSIMSNQYGVRNLPMLMKASHIRENIFTEQEARQRGLKVNSNINYHGLGKDLFMKVIDGLDDVTLAYRGTKNASDPARRENYFLLISQYPDADGNVINVPVYIEEKGQHNRVFIDTNKIATTFGREDFQKYIRTQIENKNLVRVKSRSTQASERGAPVALGFSENASNDSIAEISDLSTHTDQKNTTVQESRKRRGTRADDDPRQFAKETWGVREVLGEMGEWYFAGEKTDLQALAEDLVKMQRGDNISATRVRRTMAKAAEWYHENMEEDPRYRPEIYRTMTELSREELSGRGLTVEEMRDLRGIVKHLKSIIQADADNMYSSKTEYDAKELKKTAIDLTRRAQSEAKAEKRAHKQTQRKLDKAKEQLRENRETAKATHRLNRELDDIREWRYGRARNAYDDEVARLAKKMVAMVDKNGNLRPTRVRMVMNELIDRLTWDGLDTSMLESDTLADLDAIVHEIGNDARLEDVTLRAEEISDLAWAMGPIKKILIGSASNIYVSEVERLQEENTRLREAQKESEAYVKISNTVRDQVKKIDEWKKGTFESAASVDGDMFKKIIGKLGGVVYRGNLIYGRVREVAQDLAEWYGDPEKYKVVADIRDKEKLYSEDILEDLRAIGDEKKGTDMLSLEEMKRFSEILSYFKTITERYNKVFKQGRYQDVGEVTKRFAGIHEENKKFGQSWLAKSFSKIAGGAFFEHFGDVESVMRFHDRYNPNGFFTESFEELRQGVLATDVMAMEIRQELDKFLDAKEQKDFLKKITQETVELNLSKTTEAATPTVVLEEDSELYREIVNSGRSASAVIRDYIIRHFVGKKLKFRDGKTAMVDNTDAKELAKHAGPVKAAEISKLNEIIDLAVPISEAIEADHKKFDQFTYYKVSVRFGKQTREILLNVGHAKNDGSRHLYAITDYQRNKKGATAGRDALAGSVDDRLTSDGSENSIPQSGEKVNGAEKKTFTMTRAEAMSLYMTSKREQLQAGLVVGGINVRDAKTGARSGFDGLSEQVYRAGENITPEEVLLQIQTLQGELSGLFTEQEKAYMAMVERAMEACRDVKEKTDIDRLGYSNIIEGFYYPGKRDNLADKVDSDTFGDELQRLTNMSFNRNTVKGAKGRLLIEPINVVVDRHIGGIAMYANLTTPIENFNRIFNHDMGGNRNNPRTLATMMKEGTWVKAGEYFEKLIKDIEGAVVGDKWEQKWLGRLRGSYAKFQLGANPKTWLSQLSSLFASTTVVDSTNLLKSFSEHVDDAELDKYSPMAALRARDNVAARSQGVMDKVDRVSDILMKPIGMVDRAVVKRIFAACQLQIAEDGGAKIGTVENKEAAARLLERTLFETQQNTFMTERSAAMRSNSDIVKAFTMFSADGMKMFGRVIDGVGRVITVKERLRTETDAGKRKALETELAEANKACRRAFGALLSSALYSSALALLFTHLYGKDDEEETVAQKAQTFALDYAGNLLGGVPLLRDVYGLLADGYELDIYALSSLNDFITGTKELMTLAGDAVSGKQVSSRQIRSRARSALYATGQLFGIPVRNLYNTTRAGATLLSWVTGGALEGWGYSMDAAFYDQSYQKDLARAIEAGDEKLVATIARLMVNDKADGATGVVEDELRRLIALGQSEGGYTYTGLLPRAVGDGITYDGETVEFTKRQRKRFVEIYGAADDVLSEMMGLRQYTEADDEVKAKAIKKVYDIYYELAMDDMLGTDSADKNVLFAEAIDVGKLALIVVTADGITADVNAAGNPISGTKLRKIEAYVRALELTPAQKYMIMGYLGYRNREDCRDTVWRYVNSLANLSREEKERLMVFAGFAEKDT